MQNYNHYPSYTSKQMLQIEKKKCFIELGKFLNQFSNSWKIIKMLLKMVNVMKEYMHYGTMVKYYKGMKKQGLKDRII